MTEATFYQALGERLSKESWESLTLSTILSMMESHGLDPKSLRGTDVGFPSKRDIFLPLWREAEKGVLAFRQTLGDAHYPVKDTLFEGVMVVLERLFPYRSFLAVIEKDRLFLMNRDPLFSLAETLLSLGGVSTDGLKGFARTQGMVLVLLATFSIWLSDASPDQGPTLSALDRHLSLAEQVMGTLGL